MVQQRNALWARRRDRRGALQLLSMRAIVIVGVAVPGLSFVVSFLLALPGAISEAQSGLAEKRQLKEEETSFRPPPGPPPAPPVQKVAIAEVTEVAKIAEPQPAQPTQMTAPVAEQPQAQPAGPVPTETVPIVEAKPFDDFVAGIELPPFKLGPKPITLGKLHFPAYALAQLELFAPKLTGSNKGTYSLEKGDGKTPTWNVVSNKPASKKLAASEATLRKPMAAFLVNKDEIQFQWLDADQTAAADELRDCALAIQVGGQKMITALRRALVQDPIALDLDRETMTIPIRENISAADGALQLEFIGASPTSPVFSAGYGLMEPTSGRVRPGDSLRLSLTAGGSGIELKATPLLRGNNLSVKLEPLIDVGTGKPVPFTRARADRMSKNPLYQGVGSALKDAANQNHLLPLSFRVFFVSGENESEVFRAGSDKDAAAPGTIQPSP